MKVVKIHKVEKRGTTERILVEFEADVIPASGWLTFFTDLVALPAKTPTTTTTKPVHATPVTTPTLQTETVVNTPPAEKK